MELHTSMENNTSMENSTGATTIPFFRHCVRVVVFSPPGVLKITGCWCNEGLGIQITHACTH